MPFSNAMFAGPLIPQAYDLLPRPDHTVGTSFTAKFDELDYFWKAAAALSEMQEYQNAVNDLAVGGNPLALVLQPMIDQTMEEACEWVCLHVNYKIVGH